MKTETRIGRSGTESYTWVVWGGKGRGQGCAAGKRKFRILSPNLERRVTYDDTPSLTSCSSRRVASLLRSS